MMRLSMIMLVLGLVVLGSAGTSRAETLVVSSPATFSYTTTLTGFGTDTNVGAGDFPNATLTPIGSLPFMYCVDLTHNINFQTYSNTFVTSNGYVKDLDAGVPNAAPVYAYIDSPGFLHNLGAVEHLIDIDGAPLGTQAQQMGLQLAIWQLEYGKNLTSATASNAGAAAVESGLLTAVGYNAGTGNASASANSYKSTDVIWISPQNPDGTWAQAQISIDVNANQNFLNPVPGNLVMSSILFGMFGVGWTYKRLKQGRAAA